MNKKYARVVVILFLAVATLATTGFSAPYPDRRMASILPDVLCELIPANLTAVELLTFVDEPCFTGSLDEIELEIAIGTPALSSRALIKDILARSRDVGPWPADLFEQSETDVTVVEPKLEILGRSSGKALVESIVGHSIDAGPLPAGWSGLRATNVAGNELDRGVGRAPSGKALVESIVGYSIDAGPSPVGWSGVSATNVAENERTGKALVESILGHSIDAAPLPAGWSGLSATNVAGNELDLGIAGVLSGKALVESIVGHSIDTGS